MWVSRQLKLWDERVYIVGMQCHLKWNSSISILKDTELPLSFSKLMLLPPIMLLSPPLSGLFSPFYFPSISGGWGEWRIPPRFVLCREIQFCPASMGKLRSEIHFPGGTQLKLWMYDLQDPSWSSYILRQRLSCSVVHYKE